MRRILFSIAIFLFSLASVMSQKIPITLPADGNWPTIVGDSIMLIGPRQNELTEEQRYFNPVYLMVYPGKEHLAAQIIRAGLCDCDLTKPNRRIGVFSVAPDKKVSFSQGNLQYLPAINLWKFADTQYEYLGNANKYLKPTFRNWVDLFGWSANNTTAPFGVSTSTNAADYAGDFVDWGTNAICGDAPNTWRTLSVDEWDYLFKKRTNAAQLYSKGSIEGTRGMIVLPDNWALPEGVQFTVDTANLTMDLDLNAYSYAEWQKMEGAGAVFLCVTGRRDGNVVGYLQEYGGYWTNSRIGEHVYHMYYNYRKEYLITDYQSGGQSYGVNGRSVRLVHDTIVPKPPKRIGVFSVAADKKVSFSQGNLQYVQSTKTWQFAKEQYAYMGEKHYRNGQLADTIEYFGWSGKDSKAPWGISLSTESSDYEGEFLDWGTNTIAGSAPNTWRTLSNDEWLYICQGRKNADQLLGLGTIGAVTGLIILPDDWQLPAGLSFIPNTDDATKNQYTYAQWAEMENVGAVFIPNNGYMNVKLGGMRKLGTDGYVRTSTLADDGRQIYTVFHPNKITYTYSGNNEGNLFYAFSQRLVHDTIVPKPEPEYVDLGLSVKWATFNVGATSPEDYGDYFAWGETETKETYSWATYKWGTSSNMTKYNTTDGKTILDLDDDAAYVNWGGKWRMPSKEEVDELTQQCNWIWTTHNNVNGYKVTGPNGNSIFLPAAGYKGAGPTYPAGEDGLYWTNTIEKGHYSYLIVLHDDAPPTQAGSSGTRCFGFAVRAVYDDKPPKRIGVFSVAADKQVSFSQGNLQYTQSTDEWRFAREQYDYIGKGNITNGQLGHIIDMFGWSADADPANKWGVTIAKEGFDGDFVDWGLNYIHGEAPGSWRTLSQDEWSYLISCRQHATELWGVAQVAGVNGVIILPDRWSPTDDLPFVAGINENGYAAQQTLSVEQWQLMEELGAVFLPAAGGRDGASLAFSHIDSVGWYWLSTPTDPGKASCVRFEYNLMVQRNGWRQAGLSVRLVHDTILPPPEPEYVDLGLSVKWATFNVGATSPEDYGDYFAWGETQPKDEYSWKKYKWSNGTGNNITITKYNSTDSKHVLEPEDDAAHVLWGGKWRMPTVEEQTELREQCIWTWTSINGIWGHLVTGPNGKSIFLPAAGNITNTDLSYANVMGYQWSSSVKPGICAHRMHFSKNIIEDYDGGSRACGASIRPVYDDRVE